MGPEEKQILYSNSRGAKAPKGEVKVWKQIISILAKLALLAADLSARPPLLV